MKEYLKKRGFDDEIIKEWNLEPETNYVNISYFDTEGKLLYKRKNWPGGDPGHNKAKYVNPNSEELPENRTWLYNLQKIKDIKETMLLVEGEYNCISCWIMGSYGIGVSGQTRILKDYDLKLIPERVKKIIVLYDDVKFATERAREILKYFDYDKEVYIAKYPDSRDANDYYKEGNTTDFKAIINIADRYLEDKLTRTDIKVKIPANDFIESYKEYTMQISDAPAKYQELMALSIISTILGRQVYMPWFNDSLLYPNLFIVLIGKSTIMRKSESMSLAIKMIRTINNDRIFPGQFTQEALFGLLENKPVGVISWAEFGGFLAGASKSYMAGTTQFLTALYDCPDFLEKKLVGDSYKIENPCINIITGTTIQYFTDWLSESNTFGGFYGRFLYIPCTPEDKNGYFPNPLPLKDQPIEKKYKLINRLKEIKEIEGAFEVSEEAFPVLTWWLIRNNDEMEKFSNDDKRLSFYGRYDGYLRKLAMLYEISASGKTVISETSAWRAIKMMNNLKEDLIKLIGEHFVFTKEAKDMQKVLSIIKEYGDPIPRGVLTYKSGLGARIVNETIASLIQSDRIKLIHAGEGRKRTVLYSII